MTELFFLKKNLNVYLKKDLALVFGFIISSFGNNGCINPINGFGSFIGISYFLFGLIFLVQEIFLYKIREFKLVL